MSQHTYTSPMLVQEYKLRGKPEQFARIDEAIRTMQFVRNRAIRFWMDHPGVGRFDLSTLSKTLAAEFAFAKKLNSTARQAACDRAWASVAQFYNNCKKKVSGRKGFPRFKKNVRSVEYKNSGWKLTDGGRKILLTDGHQIGSLKLLGKRSLDGLQHLIKRVRVLRRADGYYVQFVINAQRHEMPCYTGQSVGLDMGLTHFFTDSKGCKVENPRLLKRAEKSLSRRQRKFSRMTKGSNRRKRAKFKLARTHLKVQRQRNDFVTKLARSVVRSHDLVAIEDLQVRNMVKNRSLAKSISDAGWSLFKTKLSYYAGLFKKVIVAVNPRYTSQTCSSCNKVARKSLSNRSHQCNCGCVLDRDHNAALNILRLGVQALSKATAGHAESYAPGESVHCLGLATDQGKTSR
jgi:putative transposase